MDKLLCMRVFVEAAKSGSFVGAADALSMSAPAVTRCIAHLESQLNTRLFHRTTRQIKLSEVGGHYLSHASRILADIEQSEAAVSGLDLAPQGELNITAPILFGERYITPIISQFLKDYPNISINGHFHDDVVNLIDNNIDVAIRIGKPKDSSLYGVTVGYVRRVTCAAPAYLESSGPIEKPEDLKQHSILFPTRFNEPAIWTYHKGGKAIPIKLTPRFQSNQNRAAINAAKDGVGIVRLMSYQVADALKSGELVSLLEDVEDNKLPIQVVSVEGRKNLTKIKTFIDYVKAGLANNEYLNPK